MAASSWNILSLLLIIITSGMAMMASAAGRGAYYPSWAQPSFPPSAIKTELFTHLYYAFINPNPSTFTFHIDPDLSTPQLLNFTSTLHSADPPVTALFAVGGYAEGSSIFSRMAADASTRRSFILSTIQLCRSFGFDGVDLDWEFPEDSKDMENLGVLLDEWRMEVTKEATATGRPPLLLTAAVYYSSVVSLSGHPLAYPSASMVKNLDWINVMTYDFHGAWDKTATGAHAALFDPTRDSRLSTSYGLGSWIRAGVPAGKLAMGLPLYGRTWRLKDHRSDGIGSSAVDVGPGENETGVLSYTDVVRFNREHKARVFHDVETVSAYSVAGTSWIGYDDAKSVTVKIAYARALGFHGYFFWAVNNDYNWEISETASKTWCIS